MAKAWDEPVEKVTFAVVELSDHPADTTVMLVKHVRSHKGTLIYKSVGEMDMHDALILAERLK